MVKRLSFLYSLGISFWRAETEFLLEWLIADSRYGQVYKKLQGLYLYAVFCIEDILQSIKKMILSLSVMVTVRRMHSMWQNWSEKSSDMKVF